MSKIKLLRSKLSTFILMFAMLTTLVCPKTAVSAQLTTDFDQLNQTELVSAMGAGWNLGNTMEALNDYGPNEEAWGNPKVTTELFKAVKKAGFKSVRIPVTLLTSIGSAPDYTIDATRLARIKEVVDYAYNEGLYVILDGVHGDGYHTINGSWLLVTASDQEAVKVKYQKVWEQYANTFKDYDEHLIFESMNEVFDGNYSNPDPQLYKNLNAYNQIFVDTIRKTGGNNASRWLLVPGWNTNIDHMTLNYGFVVPTDNYRSSSIPSDEKRIMISAHYYSPYEFTLDNSSQITQWGSISTNSSKKTTWCQEDYMDSQLAQMYNSFVTKGYPVVIGEYCATDKSDKDADSNIYRAYFCKMLCTICKKYGAIPVYWDIGAYGPGGSGLIDRKTYSIINQPIVDAIMSIMSTTPTPTVTPTASPTVAPTATPTVAPTASPTLAPTVTPIVTATPTIAPITENSIKLQIFNGNTTESTNTINPNFKIFNNTETSINLSDVKIRYYFTKDDTKSMNYLCDWAVAGSGNITSAFYTIDKTNADCYLEIGFTNDAGTLLAGANTEVKGRIWRSDWSNFTQTNDYSFNESATNYIDWSNVTGYINGNLVWGIEP